MTVGPETPRCWTMDNKVIFETKPDAEKALLAFKAAHSGKGKIVRCHLHGHYHLTKNQKGVRRSRKERRR